MRVPRRAAAAAVALLPTLCAGGGAVAGLAGLDRVTKERVSELRERATG
eukprot:gene16644-10998_t